MPAQVQDSDSGQSTQLSGLELPHQGNGVYFLALPKENWDGTYLRQGDLRRHYFPELRDNGPTCIKDL